MKIIYQPLKKLWISQAFGENRACINDDNEVIGCDGNNPPEGYKSLYGPQGHKGVDLVAPHGDEVYAAQRGVVYRIDPNKWSGLDVRIESEINGRKIRHIYEHLSGYQPQKGDYIETGQVIGWVGNTGLSSGAHLHFEAHENIDGIWTPVDPMSVMEQIPAYQILAINNTLTYITEQVATIADNIANYLRRSGTKRSVGN